MTPTLLTECPSVAAAERFIARSAYRGRLYYVATPKAAVRVWLAPMIENKLGGQG